MSVWFLMHGRYGVVQARPPCRIHSSRSRLSSQVLLRAGNDQVNISAGANIDPFLWKQSFCPTNKVYVTIPLYPSAHLDTHILQVVSSATVVDPAQLRITKTTATRAQDWQGICQAELVETLDRDACCTPASGVYDYLYSSEDATSLESRLRSNAEASSSGVDGATINGFPRPSGPAYPAIQGSTSVGTSTVTGHKLNGTKRKHINGAPSGAATEAAASASANVNGRYNGQTLIGVTAGAVCVEMPDVSASQLGQTMEGAPAQQQCNGMQPGRDAAQAPVGSNQSPGRTAANGGTGTSAAATSLSQISNASGQPSSPPLKDLLAKLLSTALAYQQVPPSAKQSSASRSKSRSGSGDLILSTIRSAKGLADLQQVYNRHARDLKIQHVSLLLKATSSYLTSSSMQQSHAASVHQTSYPSMAAGATAQQQGISPATASMIKGLLKKAVFLSPEATPRHLAGILQSMVVLGQQHLAPRMPHAAPHQLPPSAGLPPSNTPTSPAQAATSAPSQQQQQHRPDAQQQHLLLTPSEQHQFVSAMLEHSQGLLASPHALPRDFSRMLCALGRLQHMPSQSWLSAMYQASQPLLPSCSLDDLLGFIYGLAHVAPDPPSCSRLWMQRYYAQLQPHIKALSVKQICNLMFGIARAPVKPSSAWITELLQVRGVSVLDEWGVG